MRKSFFTALGFGLAGFAVLALLGVWPATGYLPARTTPFELVYLVGCGLTLVKFARGRSILPRSGLWDSGGHLARGVPLLLAPLWTLIDEAFGLVGSVKRWHVSRSDPSADADRVRGSIRPGDGLVLAIRSGGGVCPLVVGAHIETLKQRLGGRLRIGEVRTGRAASVGLRGELRDLTAHLARRLRGETSVTVAGHDVTGFFGPDDRLRSIDVEDEGVTLGGVPVVGRLWTRLPDVAGDAYGVLDVGHGLDRTPAAPLDAGIAFPAAGLRLTLHGDKAVACTIGAPFAADGTRLRRLRPDELESLGGDAAAQLAAWHEEEGLRHRWRRAIGIGALVLTVALVAGTLAYGPPGPHPAILVATSTVIFLILRLVLLRRFPIPIEIDRPAPWARSILGALGVKMRLAGSPRTFGPRGRAP